MELTGWHIQICKQKWLYLTNFSIPDTWESSRVPEVLSTDEQGNNQTICERQGFKFPGSFHSLCGFSSGRFPLQYAWLWLDRGRLHSRGPEVSDAAAGALPLHEPARHLREALWRRQRGESTVWSPELTLSSCFYPSSLKSFNKSALNAFVPTVWDSFSIDWHDPTGRFELSVA